MHLYSEYWSIRAHPEPVCYHGNTTLMLAPRMSTSRIGIKGEVQSRITIISKERVKISLQIGAKIMKIG